MFTKDEMTQQMGKIRDQLIESMFAHERIVHGGKPCWGNRASAVAYLAHCLGLGSRPQHLEVMLEQLQEYERECINPQCTHRTVSTL